MNTSNKYIEAKLEDAAIIKRRKKRTLWLYRILNSDNSSWNFHNKSM